MFEPDEYLFTKFAYYFKRRKKAKQEQLAHAVKLVDIKQRLTIFARAITGESIEIYDAEREGGYRNNNFFLPTKFSDFQSTDENIAFYLFRILYVSVQKNLDLNWKDDQEHDLAESRGMALETSKMVLASLFEQFPITKEYHEKFKLFYDGIPDEKVPTDYSFIYGKWMRNSPKNDSGKQLQNFTDQVKKQTRTSRKQL